MKRFLILAALILFFHAVYGQQIKDGKNIRILFYNVENLFDTIDNAQTNDNEFLPEGSKNWNGYRYWKKINQIFQVIAAAGGDTPPEIIGFCEVEDFLPLYHIINNTPLLKYSYKIVHYNSPDHRGIDVALLIRKDAVKLISSRPVRVSLDTSGVVTTRDILYASLLVGSDTLHTFVNHWPSRMGGQAKSEPKRMLAASTLKALTDSITKTNAESKILVMGDFNDEPENNSLRSLEDGSLINLSRVLKKECDCGTYKYRNNWNMIDQILVSENLIDESNKDVQPVLSIINKDFLLVDDQTYGGEKPFRTYLGPRYQGGFSDHLPIMLKINLK